MSQISSFNFLQNNSNKLCDCRQYGFTKDKNINDALLDVSKSKNDNISYNKRVMLVLLDLKKTLHFTLTRKT